MDAARGRRLATARKRKKLRQEDVAEKLGMSDGSVRRMERGAPIKTTVRRELSRILGVTDRYFDGEDSTEAPPGNPSSRNVKPMPGPDRQRRAPIEWPQWAREKWAELQLELTRQGADDTTLQLLRSFVLADELHGLHSGDELSLRMDVDAGMAAARAWMNAHLARGSKR